MRFGFVILHYNVVAETEKCVASILERVDAENFEIVVVDNCSPNKSGPEIQRIFAGKEHVSVILNKENVGFARGNNVGFQYLKREKSCDFIVMMNNDTYLIQDDFCKVIEDEFNQSHFAVLGPEIHCPNGLNPNPVKSSLMTVAELQKKRARWRRRRMRNILHLGFFDTLYSFIADRLGPGPHVSQPANDRRQENVELHGCCLVFSPVFVARYEGLNPNTFLYQEEDILFAQMLRDGMLMVYNPALKIYHMENASTNSVCKGSRKKQIFFYTHYLKSSEVLLDILQDIEKGR
ncbi:MAG: glycosyltransferase [Fibrobacter sp.]|nr:glycosyltransferase [Fibrobacter sp.]